MSQWLYDPVQLCAQNASLAASQTKNKLQRIFFF